jgi:hypothetical protein
MRVKMAGALGWAQGIDPAQALLDLPYERIAMLTRQWAELLIAMGGEPD